MAHDIPNTFVGLQKVRRETLGTFLPYLPPLLQELIKTSIVLGEDWEGLPESVQNELLGCINDQELLQRLLEHHLITKHQAYQIGAGNAHNLILGNYRILDCLGVGGMGQVFKAEHVRMRRLAAIKVLQLFGDAQEGGPATALLHRFYGEMRAVAQLNHPNIVAAIDAGEVESPFPNMPNKHYFVMEYVPGKNLGEYVSAHGKLAVAHGCELIYQIASALAEAHKHHLVHRDIKPMNILVTPEGQAKLLDFGLVRRVDQRMTTPGLFMGTLDYMAPEQASDSSDVDIRSDIYALGGTLYSCLTGSAPFSARAGFAAMLATRLTQPPPSARELRAEIPAELDAVIRKMMSIQRENRYPTPQAVMQALYPFLRADSEAGAATPNKRLPSNPLDFDASVGEPRMTHRVLIVDDDADNRLLAQSVLDRNGIECLEAIDGEDAMEKLKTQRVDLVLSDIDMPVMNGVELLRRLRENPPSPHLKIIMMSGAVSPDEMSRMLAAGADDYLTKPLSLVQLHSRAAAALKFKDAVELSDSLNRRLLDMIAGLETNLSARDSDLVEARNALVVALAQLVAQRNMETAGHPVRIQRFCRILAEEAGRMPHFSAQIDANFVNLLENVVPLKDIGTVALPDHILLKPGKLDADERIIMQDHTVLGAATLKKVAQRLGGAMRFFEIAADVTRHHHERFDGTGYPDRLAGEQIPLTARVATVADVYDALRSRRAYRPPMSHANAVKYMVETDKGHFDPMLLKAFENCAAQFERIFRELPDWRES